MSGRLPLLPGPVVVLSPAVCAALAGVLRSHLDGLVGRGVPVPRGVLEAVEAIVILADGCQKASDQGRNGDGRRGLVFHAGHELCNVAEASRLAGCSERTVRRHLADGRLAGVQPAGTWMVDREALAEWRPRRRELRS